MGCRTTVVNPQPQAVAGATQRRDADHFATTVFNESGHTIWLNIQATRGHPCKSDGMHGFRGIQTACCGGTTHSPSCAVTYTSVRSRHTVAGCATMLVRGQDKSLRMVIYLTPPHHDPGRRDLVNFYVAHTCLPLTDLQGNWALPQMEEAVRATGMKAARSFSGPGILS